LQKRKKNKHVEKEVVTRDIAVAPKMKKCAEKSLPQ
jgi:hypothetical protein